MKNIYQVKKGIQDTFFIGKLQVSVYICSAHNAERKLWKR